MAQLTVVFNVLKHDFHLQLALGVSPEDDEDEPKEIVMVESSGDHQIRRVGFVSNEEPDEGEED